MFPDGLCDLFIQIDHTGARSDSWPSCMITILKVLCLFNVWGRVYKKTESKSNISRTTASRSQCKCGRIQVYTGPEMTTRQEKVPHIPKAEFEFNEVWMDEHIRGGSYTIQKIIPRDP